MGWFLERVESESPEGEHKRQLQEYQNEIKCLWDLYAKSGFFLETLKHPQAIEECERGLEFRIQYIARCLKQFINISPPGRRKKFNLQEFSDMNIYLHQFHSNMYGGVDNLAWIWFYEKNQGVFFEKENKKVVNLFNEKFIKYFKKNDEIFKLCKKAKPWYQSVTKYRDFTTHSIPISITYAYDELTNKDKKEFDHLLYLNASSNNQLYVYFHDRNIADVKSFKFLVSSFIDKF